MNIVLKDPSGIIKTPGYPSTYPLSLTTQCIWKIIAPKGQVIRLEFSSFRMGRYSCLSVQHRIGKKHSLQFYKCATQPSFTVYSIGNVLSLKLSSYRDFLPGPGFIANYTFFPAGENIGFDRFYYCKSSILKLPSPSRPLPTTIPAI